MWLEPMLTDKSCSDWIGPRPMCPAAPVPTTSWASLPSSGCNPFLTANSIRKRGNVCPAKTHEYGYAPGIHRGDATERRQDDHFAGSALGPATALSAHRLHQTRGSAICGSGGAEDR